MQNSKNWKKCVFLAMILLFIGIIILPSSVSYASDKNKKKANFTIKPSSKPYDKRMLKYGTYNKYTKHYYLLLSYLMELEKRGGGTLTLKKGTYSITNVLYIPSNVTIVLSDGVVVKKSKKTGTKYMDASKSIFQLIKPSKSNKKKAYGKYNSSKNVKIIGKGKAVIDLCYVRDSIAIIAGHNQNVTIDNITFKNMNSGHFLEVTAVKNMTIKNSKFMNSKPSEKLNKEAINIDTPDKATKGFNILWSKQDKTPDKDITIMNNYFYNLDRAIGTHKYSQVKNSKGKYTVNIYHSGIVIKNNIIDKTRSDAIRVLNWKNSVIEGNTIRNLPRSGSVYRGILVSGAVNLTVKKNTFKDMARPIQILPTKNLDTGSMYSVTYNKLTEQNKKDMKQNKIIRVEEAFIRINSTYNNFDNPDRIYLKEG